MDTPKLLTIKLSLLMDTVIEHLFGTATGHTIEQFVSEGWHVAFGKLLSGDVDGFVNALPASAQAGVKAWVKSKTGVSLP